MFDAYWIKKKNEMKQGQAGLNRMEYGMPFNFGSKIYVKDPKVCIMKAGLTYDELVPYFVSYIKVDFHIMSFYIARYFYLKFF